MILRWLAQGRGLTRRVVGYLAMSVAVTLISATVGIQLRTAADAAYAGPVLQNGILLGLVPPIAVLGSLLQDRSPWLSVTTPRSQTLLRTVWLGALLLAALSVGSMVAWFLPADVPMALVMADFVALFALAVAGAVILGGPLAWVPPASAALACSVPGLVPIEANWLSLADHAMEVGALGTAGIVIFGMVFIVIDEHGVSRYRRIFERLPGVVDD